MEGMGEMGTADQMGTADEMGPADEMGAADVLGASGSVVVRRMRVADLPAYAEWLQPHHEWHEWDGPYYAKPTPAEIDNRVQILTRELMGQSLTPPNRAVIVHKDRPRDLIGTVSWYWESEETNWRRMGITIYDPSVRGQGVGTSALAAWTTYLFQVTDVVRLDFATWSGNLGMLSVGKKLAFTEEARFRRARVVKGHHFDSVVMGVLREEWQPADVTS